MYAGDETMKDYYCILCRCLHRIDTDNPAIRILSTGYHIVGEQRYQICICNIPQGSSAAATE